MEEISAQRKADELRVRAAVARAEADRLEQEAARWALGAEGERLTAAALQGLGRDAVVLHDRLLEPGISRVNLDHVVISAAGVFLVDTKYWSGDVSIYDGNLWQHTQTSADRKHHPKHQELDKASRAAAAMERVLSGPVVPTLALAASRQTGFYPERVRGVQVLPLTELVPWLKAQPAWLSPAQIESTARRVASAFPPAVGGPPESRAVTTSTYPPPRSGARPGTSAPPVRRARAGSRNRRPRKPGRRGRTRPGVTLIKLVLGLGAIWLLLTLLPVLVALVGSRVGPVLR